MDTTRTLKDPAREKRIFSFRVVIALLFVFSLTGVLIWRMYDLQVLQHDTYSTLSDKNRMQLQSIAPTRGLIYDRNGILLAENRPVFSVTLVKEQIKDMEATLERIGSLVELTDEHIERFQKRLNERRRPFEPVPLKYKLSEEEIARLAVDSPWLPGVEVAAELVRYYPFGELYSHMLGYVARINEAELKKLDPVNYSATNYIGKLGVEKFYEPQLHGQVGYQTVETNARGRVMHVLDRTDPRPGNNLYLHTDVRLQLAARDALGDRRGAVVALEPETGGVLALVSTPGYDPNLFVTGIGHKSYAALRDSLDLPLFNRAIRGQYPPGSTIKPMIALAGLEYNVVTPSYTIWDPGWYQLKNDERLYRDWKREGHGRINLYDSVVQSCDTYYYELAFKLGVDRMSEYLDHFGFGKHHAYDIGEARSGILPTREWKRGARGLPWFPGDSLNLGIGQGFMLATPLQLATATAVLANRGEWHRPALAMGIEEGEIRELRDAEHAPLKLRNEANWGPIIESMYGVMHGKRGTARSSGRGAPYKMAGKTGTAQVVGIAQGEEYDEEALAERLRDHALFIGFAPLDNPRIAVAVIVENGGGGSRAAAPVARTLFDKWLLELDPGSPYRQLASAEARLRENPTP